MGNSMEGGFIEGLMELKGNAFGKMERKFRLLENRGGSGVFFLFFYNLIKFIMEI